MHTDGMHLGKGQFTTEIRYCMQDRSATLNVEVDNIRSLIGDLKQLREQLDAILAESKLVLENIGKEPVLPERRQSKPKRFADESMQDDNEHAVHVLNESQRLVVFPITHAVHEHVKYFVPKMIFLAAIDTMRTAQRLKHTSSTSSSPCTCTRCLNYRVLSLIAHVCYDSYT